MKKNLTEKNCKNCKFYVEHYILLSTHYHPIGGHCINENIYPYKKNSEAAYDNCAYWQSGEDKNDKVKKDVNKALQDIEVHLSHIASILNNDK